MTFKKTAKQARIKILAMIYQAQTSHIGSNLSIIDVMTVLYEKAKISKKDWDNRDRIVLSKGWAAASLYYCMYRKGLLTQEDLDSYCKFGSKFIGLAEPVAPGIEAAGGSMGHGVPMALGMALAAKRSGAKWKVYDIMSDGELDCGTTWESAMIASHHKLDNFTIIIDYNKFQAMDRKNSVLNVEPLSEKWWAFGWHPIEIDGHDYNSIEIALDLEITDRPKVIIAHTIKGKGVSFMEDKLEWHYRNVDQKSYELAMKELN